jgi:hypothetical protein
MYRKLYVLRILPNRGKEDAIAPRKGSCTLYCTGVKNTPIIPRSHISFII